MTRTEEIKRRADRLLRGDGTFEDLNTLFLWLRGRSFGQVAVKEVGDFVAHADSRDKGEARRALGGLSTVFNFHFRRNDLQETRPYSEFVAAARASFDSETPAEIRNRFGISQRKGKAALERALSRTFPLGKGFRISRTALTTKELEVLKHFTSILHVRPLFTDLELANQFLTALTKNGIIGPRAFSANALVQLALFTIIKMHLTTIPLPDGKQTILHASWSGAAHKPLSVTAQMPNPKGGGSTFGVPVFTTSLLASVYCEPELLDIILWDFPIELNASGRLQMLA